MCYKCDLSYKQPKPIQCRNPDRIFSAAGKKFPVYIIYTILYGVYIYIYISKYSIDMHGNIQVEYLYTAISHNAGTFKISELCTS